MATIWGLFSRFEDAGAAVLELEQRQFDPADINAVLLDAVARPFVNNQDAAEVAGARATGRPAPAGLDKLLVDRRPVRVADTGPLLTVGVLAVQLGKTASAVNRRSSGLGAALVDFGLPAARAQLYAKGVAAGQVLLALRATGDQERTAVGILNKHKVAELAGFPG